MVFTISPTGAPIAQSFPDGGGNAELPYAGDWQLVVTGVPAGTSAATIAGLITSSPVAIPLPFKSFHWTIAYSSLGSACTAVAY
jgi:hypothetical protein